MNLIGSNFRSFLPVVFGWTFLESVLLSILISIKIIWLFGLKPQAFLLNGTLIKLLKLANSEIRFAARDHGIRSLSLKNWGIRN